MGLQVTDTIFSLNVKTIKSKMVKWVGHVARMEKMRNAYKIVVAMSEGKRLFVRPSR